MRPSGVDPALLLIAIGNTLRRDDGAGASLAARLEPLLRAASIPLEVEIVHQLTPELAEAVSQSALTLFLDARVDAREPLEWRALQPDAGPASLGHHMQPEAVLALARGLFGYAPPAALLTVHGEDFSHGEGLSATAEADVNRVDGWLQKILGEYFRAVRIRPRPSAP